MCTDIICTIFNSWFSTQCTQGSTQGGGVHVVESYEHMSMIYVLWSIFNKEFNPTIYKSIF